MMRTDKAVIIFSGFNDRAVIAFLRTLSANNVNFGIIAVSKDDPIHLTDYAKRVFAIRRQKLLNLDDLMESIKKVKQKLKASDYLIAPSTEALNRFLLDHRQKFKDEKIEIPLVDKKMYETVSDKLSFNKLCAKFGINVPKRYAKPHHATLPYVAKPRHYYLPDGSAPKPTLAMSQAEHKQLLNLPDFKEYFFQDYIHGSSWYLLYYFYRDGKMIKFSQQNLIQQSGGNSMVAAKPAGLHQAKVSSDFEKMFRSIGFYGLVMVEVKKHRGKYYMIEANPRFWGPSQLFVDAGRNLFEAFLHDFGLVKAKPKFSLNKNTRYFWSGGIKQAEKGKTELDFHDYDFDKYRREQDSWHAADIYNRDDTKKIFHQESWQTG